jgi:hypothetical protein
MNVNTMAQNLFAGMAAADLDSALGRLNALNSQVRSLAIIGITNAASDPSPATVARPRRIASTSSPHPNPRKPLFVRGE